MKYFSVILFISILLVAPATKAAEVFIEKMTWSAVAQAIANGKTSILIPTGGTEQNGPHVSLGKHNTIIQYTAQKIAQQHGNMLVAPVMAYVPEGRISPPEGHMKFAGTLSLSEKTFRQVLQQTAASLKQHGFKKIYFMGDSGSSQRAQRKVAKKLTRKWRKDGVIVAIIDNYYFKNRQKDWLLQQGFTAKEIGMHAGIRDTSELVALEPSAVNLSKVPENQYNFDATGMDGAASKATSAIGKKLLQLKISAAIEQIKNIEMGGK